MMIEFVKMNGAGNDFVMIDNRARSIHLNRGQIIRLCDRQRGVGADGLMMLVPCASGRADWAWEFHNSDGSVADMCGNGARCFGAFVRRLTGTKDGVSIETGAGIVRATFEDQRVVVELTPPKHWRMNQRLHTSAGDLTVHSVNTGVPHAVVFVEDTETIDVARLGAELRRHAAFMPAGANVNFVRRGEESRIHVRTFERGVENETLACGTGVTAAALVTARLHGVRSPVEVQVHSGDWLQVRFHCGRGESGESGGGSGDSGGGETPFDTIQLGGPAEFVFEGRIVI